VAAWKAGCAHGASRGNCAELHLRELLPLALGSKRDRQCPVCGGNLSINAARNADQHVVITCHGQCRTAAKDDDAPRRCALIREAFIALGAEGQCLGGFGKLSGKQLAALGPGGVARCQHDRALEDDGLRFRLHLKVPREWVRSIRDMAEQRITELPAAELPSDPYLLLPSGDKNEWYALASRAGIDKRDRAQLHRKWMLEDGLRSSRSLRAPST
jgi:hypothetical protein